MTFLRGLFAPLPLVAVYIVIRVLIEGRLGLILAITTVVVGMALDVRSVKRNRRSG